MEGKEKHCDNIEDIKDLLVFGEDTYYTLMILQRRKDSGNEDMTEESKRIYLKFISTPDSLGHLENEIRTICNSLNARAYIDLNPRSYKKFTYELGKALLFRAYQQNYYQVHRLQYKIATSEETISTRKLLTGRRWMFDVDGVEYPEKDLIIPEKILKTPSGYHVIVSSFNYKAKGLSFEKECMPGITLKPGCLVLLYK